MNLRTFYHPLMSLEVAGLLIRNNYLPLILEDSAKGLACLAKFLGIDCWLKSGWQFFDQQYFADNEFFDQKLSKHDSFLFRPLKLTRHSPIHANHEKQQNGQYIQRGTCALIELAHNGLIRYSSRDTHLPVSLFKHCQNLFFGNTGKIFHKFFNANTCFKVLKQSRDRNTSALKTQCPTQMQCILNGINFVRFQFTPIHTSNIPPNLIHSNNFNYEK